MNEKPYTITVTDTGPHPTCPPFHVYNASTPSQSKIETNVTTTAASKCEALGGLILHLMEKAPNQPLIIEKIIVHDLVTHIKLEDKAKLEKLRHAFKDGHTDDDAASVLKKMKALTGLHLAVVFKFHDMHGTSGDSDLCVVGENGTMLEVPEPVRAFLYDGEGSIETLPVLQSGVIQFKGKKPIRMNNHVYVWEIDTSKEWSDTTGFDEVEPDEEYQDFLNDRAAENPNLP